jgi:hypothetical protein
MISFCLPGGMREEWKSRSISGHRVADLSWHGHKETYEFKSMTLSWHCGLEEWKRLSRP